ncbi:MAG: anion permease [Deltaproteobacteria bacterium]|nr:anion permease [Deltaproteobacteria bacterium]
MATPVVNVLLVAFSSFFALNMGGTGFSPAFSAALGANLIRRTAALLLFATFVGIGALLVGENVVKTLGAGFVPPETIDRPTALVLVAAAAGALFLANVARIPQSTTWVTVFALISLGMVRGNLSWHTFVFRLLPAWLTIPPVAFLATWLFARRLYPLRGWNYRLYEHLTKHEWKLRALVIASSCYVALGIGASNVPNVVAPLATAGVFSVQTGMLLFTPVFALGGLVFSRTAKTIGSEVVPLGLYSATIINVVVGSLILASARLGIPQSLVQAQVLCVFAIAFAKEGGHGLLRHRMLRKIVLLWIGAPLVAAALVALQLLMFD